MKKYNFLNRNFVSHSYKVTIQCRICTVMIIMLSRCLYIFIFLYIITIIILTIIQLMIHIFFSFPQYCFNNRSIATNEQHQKWRLRPVMTTSNITITTTTTITPNNNNNRDSNHYYF